MAIIRSFPRDRVPVARNALVTSLALSEVMKLFLAGASMFLTFLAIGVYMYGKQIRVDNESIG